MLTTPNSDKPTLALAVGDAAGIGPELAAKLLGDPAVTSVANLVVIGDRRVLMRGAEVARVTLDLPATTSIDEVYPGRTVMLDLGNLDPDTIKVGVASKESGACSLQNFRVGLQLAQRGIVNALCFTPFNKAAMRMAYPSYDDEVGFISSVLDIRTPASEFNIIAGLWNARVTSHIPISAVAEHIKYELVLSRIQLTHDNLREAGFKNPRIAVAGLNPHAGDGGNFGHEDEDEIRPAVEAARARHINAEGPFPPDTVFVRASKGAFDAVLTMYHDQGQIAMKLLGFDSGVTLLGGYPFPVCTPAHGSAYDIAGKGIANPGAGRAALLLATKMALR
jgi:4-hydroxythreonine-4-phosphate dehydrogenase